MLQFTYVKTNGIYNFLVCQQSILNMKGEVPKLTMLGRSNGVYVPTSAPVTRKRLHAHQEMSDVRREQSLRQRLSAEAAVQAGLESAEPGDVSTPLLPTPIIPLESLPEDDVSRADDDETTQDSFGTPINMPTYSVPMPPSPILPIHPVLAAIQQSNVDATDFNLE